MNLQARFFDLVEKSHQCYTMAQDLLASGDPLAAQEECRACTQYKAQALLIVRNNQAVANLIGWIESET